MFFLWTRQAVVPMMRRTVTREMEMMRTSRVKSRAPPPVRVSDSAKRGDLLNVVQKLSSHLALSKHDEEEDIYFKETFRVFSKDEDGCITADEMKFVLSQVCSMEEAEEMMRVVDRNGDGGERIFYIS